MIMKNTLQRASAALPMAILLSAAAFFAASAVAADYEPLLGDVSVKILHGGPLTAVPPIGAIGLSTSKTGLERPVYFRPGSPVALWIGFSNVLPVGCVPNEFKDDIGTTIPVWVKLDCYGKPWQGAVSRSGKVFTVKPL